MIYATIIYMAILCIIGLMQRKHKSGDDFLIAGRSSNWLLIAASVFTLIGGGELATLATLSFIFGFNGIFLFVGYAIGFLGLALLSSRIRKNAEVELFHSLPDYVYAAYGKVPGLITTVLSFVAFLALLIIQFSAGALIVASLSGWSYETSVLITGAVISTYLMLGGFKSVLATDVVQGAAMLILLPIILWAIQDTSPLSSGINQFEDLDLMTILSFVFTGIFAAMASADVWQRIFAAKNTKSARTGLTVASVLFILFGLGICGLGIFARYELPDIDPNNAFIESVTHLLPSWTASIVILLVMSSILSTADTEIFLLASISAREITRWKKGFKSNRVVSENTHTGLARIAIVVITLLSMALSIYLSNLVELYIILLSVVLVISPPVIIGFFLKLANWAVTLSIGLSLLTFIVLVAMQELTADNLVLIVIPSTVFTVTGWALSKKK